MEPTTEKSAALDWKSAAVVRPRLAIPIVMAVSGIIFFWALGEAAYWDRDEPRNAGCAAEMLARGNWIVPTFNDELRQQKPVLLYWLMGVAYRTFGVNEFAGRFFSALLAVGTVLATWDIARSFFDRATALLSSLILASSLMFCVAARAATPDSVLIFCVTMALWFFARGFELGQGNPFLRIWSFLGIYLFLGLAMLAKGPVGLVLPMAVMGWFLLQRDWIETGDRQSGLLQKIIGPFHPMRFWRTLLSMRILSGTLVALLVAAPWFIAVGMATDGEFLRRFFLDENFARATKVLESHSGGWWFYPLAILVGFFPWSTFWGPVVMDMALRKKLDDGSRFAICWIVVQVVAFSLVKTKLPSYVTPCYPALAMLTANWLMHLARSTHKSPDWLSHLANGALVLSGIGISAGLWLASHRFEPIPAWLIVLGIGPAAMGLTGWLQTRSTRAPTRFAACLALAAIAAFFSTGLLGAGAASVGRQNRMALAETIRQQPSASVAAYGCLESSWVYYGEKPIVELRRDDNEDPQAAAALQQRKFWQRKPWLSPRQFASLGREGLVITTDQKWQELKKKLPEDWKVIQTADWFLKDEKLLLVGPRDSLAARQSKQTLH